MYSNAGTLIAADFYLFYWPNWFELEEVFYGALEQSGMHVLDKIIHKFEPQGETCVWLLKESHMAVHTYPEKAYFAVDIFTCGHEGNPNETIKYLNKNLYVKTYVINNVPRGTLYGEEKKYKEESSAYQ